MDAVIYEQQINEIIRRNLKYPANARRRGIEGRVLVRFTIANRGKAVEIRIIESSGASILDKASLETIAGCSFPPPPVDSMTLDIPIIYRLEEG